MRYNVTYTSSNGNSFELLTFDGLKLEKADFHKYSWNKEVIPQQYGEVLNRFTKDAKILPCTFKFKGSRQHRADLIEQGVGGAQPNISQTILKKLMKTKPNT